MTEVIIYNVLWRKIKASVYNNKHLDAPFFCLCFMHDVWEQKYVLAQFLLTPFIHLDKSNNISQRSVFTPTPHKMNCALMRELCKTPLAQIRNLVNARFWSLPNSSLIVPCSRSQINNFQNMLYSKIVYYIQAKF